MKDAVEYRVNRVSTTKHDELISNTLGYATTNSFIDKIRMLQRTQTPQRTRRNTIGRRSTRVRMTCRAFPLWLERQSLSLL